MPCTTSRIKRVCVQYNRLRHAGLCSPCLNYIIPNPQRVFVYVYSASVLPGMIPWFVILISQLRFRHAHKKAIASHPFRSILFPYANYLTMAFLICVLIGMYFNEDTRMITLLVACFQVQARGRARVRQQGQHRPVPPERPAVPAGYAHASASVSPE